LKSFFSVFLCLFSGLIHSLQATELPSELLEWAGKNPVVTVAIDDAIPPFDYVDSKGMPTGVGDIIRLKLSDVLPISLQVTSQGSLATQMDKLSKNQVDMISFCTATEEHSQTMLLSKSFLSLTPIMVTNKKNNYHTINDIPSGARIAVPKQLAPINDDLKLVDNDNIVEVKNSFIGLQMVNLGKVDALITYLSIQKSYPSDDLQALPIAGIKPILLGFCVQQGKPELVDLLNIGIERLGGYYFNRLKAEWVASLNGIDSNAMQDDSSLKKTIIFSVFAVILLLLLIYRYAQGLAYKFSTLRFKIIYFSVIITILLSVSLGLESYFKKFKERIVEAQKAGFDLTQDVTVKAIDGWYLPRLAVIKEIIRAPQFLPAIEQLIDTHESANEQLNEQQARLLNNFFKIRGNLTEQGRDYEVVDLDARVLLSSKEYANSNQETGIKKYYPGLLARVLNGHSTFIPPISTADAVSSFVSIAEPIIDQRGKVIAIFVVSFNAANNFSALFNDVRQGQTVENYAVNEDGYLLSESRFIEQLHEDNVLPVGQSAILTMRLADVANNPIINDAIFKASGRNINGYQDYMGNMVAGQWSWIDKYNFMLVSELNLDEMYLEYNELRNLLYIMMVLCISFVSVISLFMMMISHRANQINHLSQKKLEQLVDQRNQALQRSEKKNSLIVDSVADGIIGLDLQGRIVFINRAAEHLLGYQEKNVLLEHYQDVIYRCTSNRDPQLPQITLIKDSLNNGESLHVAHDEFCRRDGVEIPISYSLSVIADDNSPFKAVLTFQDISQQLRDSQQTKAMVTSLPTAILLVNMNRKIIDLNGATELLLGYQKQEILGKDLGYFIPENRQQRHQEIMDHFFADPKSIRIGNDEAITIQKKSGELIEIGAIFSLLELGNEQILALSVLDITEANHAKKLLIEAKEVADKANRSKSDFLANMSHEIRTPMNAIIGMSMLALQGTLAPKERDYVTKVNVAANNLLGILNDILDFSKIEADRLELESEAFSLDELLENFITVIGTPAQRKGVDLLFNINKDVPLFFNGDLLRLNQILINLGGNAIKFTEDGEVTLHVSVLTHESESVKLQFSIQDSGIGIKEDHLKELFSPFSQADASTTRKYGGTGLGLSISKRLVELMDGEIWVESIVDQGSEFLFTAWLGIDNSAISPPLSDISQTILTGKRILIVDDNLPTLTRLTEVAEGLGCEVFSASSGPQALLIVEKERYFDFSLIDLDMPKMNGLGTFDTLQEIKELVIEHPILMHSFNEDDIDEGDLHPANCLLVKPITALRLQQTLQALLDDEQTIPPMEKHVLAPSTQGLLDAHLLLVEDNELNQELAIALLEGEGARVSVASHGKAAVEMAQKNSYDLILMDIQMPIMDGYEATQLIRKFDNQVPILAMTANVMVGDKERVIATGMNDYLSKPFDAQKMFATIKHWLSADIATSGAYQHDLSEERYSNAPFSSLSKIDQLAGMAVCNDSRALYLNMLNMFELNNEGFSDAFTQYLQDHSWDELIRLVHSLKGGAGNIGATTLYAQLNELELSCLGHQDERDIFPLFKRVMGEFTAVKAEITSILMRPAKPLLAEDNSIVSLTDSEIVSTLNKLQGLVEEFDTEAQQVALVLLRSISEASPTRLLEDFITEVESFDFESAEPILAQLKSYYIRRDEK